MWSIAALVFVAIFFLKAPFPLIVLGAGAIGLAGGKFWESKFNLLAGHAGPETTSVLDDETESPLHTRPPWSRGLRVALVCLTI